MNCSTSRSSSFSDATLAILHQLLVVLPHRALWHLVGRVADHVTALVVTLPMQSAPELKPFGLADLQPAVVALVHLRGVSEQEAGGTDGADRLLEHPAVEVRRALELDRGHVLDGLVDGKRLDD